MASELDGATDEGLLTRLQTALLKALVLRVESGEASSSELATAAALLGKSGNLARTGEGSVKTAGAAAWEAHVDSLTKDELLSAAAAVQAKKAIPEPKPKGGGILSKPEAA